MNIFIVPTEDGLICVNSTCTENDSILIAQGGQKLSDEEVEAYGMLGYEHLVSPLTTKVLGNGKVQFTPPSDAEQRTDNYVQLRIMRDDKLESTDYLMMTDYPLTQAQREALTLYRQALRDLPSKPGAPWDGGGPETPWPVKPVI